MIIVAQYSVEWLNSEGNIALPRKHDRYLHKTNTTVFIILFAIKLAYFFFVVPLSLSLAYLSMSFILQLTFTASIAGQLHNK